MTVRGLSGENAAACDYYVLPNCAVMIRERANIASTCALSVPVPQKEAVLLLPAPPATEAFPASLRRWLKQLDVEPRGAAGATALTRAMQALGRQDARDALAGLRFWGESGERPGAWLAAADPVYLEARLDHVVIHRLPDQPSLAADLEDAFQALQTQLGGAGDLRFRATGEVGYLSSATPMPTASEPPNAVYGRELGAVMPAGSGADDYQRLQSEVQMVLHRADVQQRRIANGLPPINGLWFWGGGAAASAAVETLPPLFARDTLLRGYWYQRKQSVNVWPGSLLACAAQSPSGFVAAPPISGDSSDERLCVDSLRDGQRLLETGQLDAIRVCFDSGASVCARRRRWWHPRRNDLGWLEKEYAT